jgi:hypothetical protein
VIKRKGQIAVFTSQTRTPNKAEKIRITPKLQIETSLSIAIAVMPAYKFNFCALTLVPLRQ